MRRVCCVAVIALCFTTILASLSSTVFAQQDNQTGGSSYTDDEIRAMSAEYLLDRIDKPEPGYHKFAGMWALGKKAKESDIYNRRTILTMVADAMNDKSRTIDQRFQCCYVIQESGDEQWIPSLIDVMMKDPSEIMRSVAAEALGKFNKPNALSAMAEAAKVEKSQRVLDTIDKYLKKGSVEYTDDEIKATSAETFLERMKQAEPGYNTFAAMHALTKKAKDSDAKTRLSILNLVVTAMYDKSRMEYQRFQCCYVISDSGDDRGVPCLAYVLLNDPSSTMRSVAAEALAKFPGNTAACNALEKAVNQEKDEKVLEVLNRVLGRTKS